MLDSNLHLLVFETSASAVGLIGLKLLLSQSSISRFCIVRSIDFTGFASSLLTFHRVATLDNHYCVFLLLKHLSGQRLRPQSCYACVGVTGLEPATT